MHREAFEQMRELLRQQTCVSALIAGMFTNYYLRQ